MGNKRNLSRHKKRCFARNQHTEPKECENVSETPKSASARKLDGMFSGESNCSNESCKSEAVNGGYRLIYLPILSSIISSNLCCKVCHGNVELEEISVFGLASTYKLECGKCKQNNEFQSSPSKNNRVTEVNRRIVYAMRCLGTGLRGLEMFCGVMDLPPPVRQTTYTIIVNRILDATVAVAKDSMQRAAEKEKQLSQHQVKGHISVSGDGSWKTRGHLSRHGFVSVIGAESGKVIDVEVKSSHCKICSDRKGSKNGAAYEAWYEEHLPKCASNHKGSAGSMECNGLLDIFKRSEETYGVKYVHYIGDGDSKSYKTLLDALPYGQQIIIKKIECVGHIQKRMGTQLRNLKKTLSGKKLEDGKGIGGYGRLTDALINKLQIYYGNAIREHKDSVDDMRRAIWAIWYHVGSTDSDPQHYACPSGPDTWCGYRRAQTQGLQATYKHPHPVPAAVLKEIKPVFKNLCTTELLTRCLGANTQNANESFNNTVWRICPKTSNSGHKVVKLAVYDAVSSFNDGTFSKIYILEKLGIEVGKFTRQAFDRRDILRIQCAEKRKRESTKEARRTKRRLRFEEQSKQVEIEGPTYGAGAF